MTNKLAIVTGTSSGIGAALTRLLLSRGWQVFGIARRAVEFPGESYQHIQADLGDPLLADTLASRIEAEMAFSQFHKVALVNNAATPGQKRVYGDQSAADTFKHIAINLSAPMALMDLAVRIRPDSAHLRVVNISSGLAYRPLAGVADYCASKAGLRMAGEALAEENHPDTAVLNYSPGIVDTEMQASLREDSHPAFTSGHVFKAMHDEGRLLSAEDVSRPILEFLESEQASGFTDSRYEPA